jgi:hypothetical protein
MDVETRQIYRCRGAGHIGQPLYVLAEQTEKCLSKSVG